MKITVVKNEIALFAVAFQTLLRVFISKVNGDRLSIFSHCWSAFYLMFSILSVCRIDEMFRVTVAINSDIIKFWLSKS